MKIEINFPVIYKTRRNHLKNQIENNHFFKLGVYINDSEGWFVADSYRFGWKIETGDINWII